ncbi:hypothetical protein BT69DRAFT_1350078 [Atractiella rhizophila]|nr:hypothetical protein BT69DRAFT_1350078 [Atractiella rhizophila]
MTDPKQVDDSANDLISKLGGRLTDLDLLIQKLKTGLSVQEAVEDIVQRNTTELQKKIFGSTLGGSFGEIPKESPWTQKQAWFLVKALADNEEINFAETFANSPFEGDRAAMTALEQIEMISIQKKSGGSVIRPGKPVYRSVFQRLVADPNFATVQELLVTSKSISSTEKAIKDAQEELLELGKVWSYSSSGTPYPITARMKKVLDGMEANQKTLEGLEKKQGELMRKIKALGKERRADEDEEEKKNSFGVGWFSK